RVRESRIELGDARVCAVVEAAVRPDRTVDTMDQAHVGAHETTEAPEVEVERVHEAHRRPRRDLVELDRQVAPLELREERAEELVAPAGRWWHELMEECEIRPSVPSPRPPDVGLGPELPRRAREHAARSGVGGSESHLVRAPRPAAAGGGRA